MLEFEGRGVGEPRELCRHRRDDAHGMRDAVEKIRIAKSDVLGAGSHLLANISKHHLHRHNAKLTRINRNNWAMAAKMFAAARSLGVASGAMPAAGKNHMRVLRKRRQIAAVGRFKGQARYLRRAIPGAREL